MKRRSRGEAAVANETVGAYRFGAFVLNVERGCLQRDGRDLELRPKAFDVLRHLVERAGKLAPKDELVELAWPHVTVSDDSLAQCVSDIRRLLEDDEQRFIKTVPRRGYMFVADVEKLESGQTAAPAKPLDRDSRPGLRLSGRWHFGSFAAGLASSVVLVAVWLAATGALLEAPEATPPRYPLFQGNTTVLDQPITYPSGTPLIRAVVLDSQPGGLFEWHTHKTPAFGYVLEGEVMVDYGSKGTRVFRAGDAFLEALEWPHRASNPGTVPARIFALYIGAEGTDFVMPVAGPK
jgi:DNA-binding winged helix-turn-helix (wHTH) protein/quercetin dioxygenase-like cupin family protein